MRLRYGAFDGGPDPLEPPYDVREALDEIGDDVLAGMSPRAALNRLLRRGSTGRDGLDSLRRQARERARELRQGGRLDGTLDQIRELLDTAIEEERRALFPDPADSARMAEAELDALPKDTARAVRELAEYQWRSPDAQAAYQQIQDLLRSEVLDQQFAGMREAMQNATPEDLARVRDMISALNDMLDSDARGEHTQEQFDEFMQNFGDFFPEQPANLAELVDALARRAAAAQQLMDSLTPEQREELAGLMAQAMGEAGLADELARLRQGLQSARPDLRWGGRTRMDGEEGLGLSDATGALAELADLDQLDELLGQDYPGASLDDIDEELIERALGRAAVDDMGQLRRIERELREQGYVQKGGDGL
ncbi:MAG: von Willebrand factor type, partial [Jatrophihabitans sp.]|nr:von Willebrand factor type [Jatrophihabitans sp.]